MERTIVHLMRHGEVHNPEGVLYGRMPGYHLSELGVAMAEKVAERLVEERRDICAVIASPLERAQESAAPTARAYNLPIISEPRIIEAANDFEGEAVNRDKTVFIRPAALKRYVNPFRPSWGEPYSEIAQRMVAAIRDARERGSGGEVLMVSHQLCVWITRLLCERRMLAHDPRRRQCSLASLTSLTFTGSTLTGLSYWEPAAELLTRAADMTPGTSPAVAHVGNQGSD